MSDLNRIPLASLPNLFIDLENDRKAQKAIIERIMTQHWDLDACLCWVCQEGREAGCRPREKYASWQHPDQDRPKVRVEWVESL